MLWEYVKTLRLGFHMTAEFEVKLHSQVDV